MTNANAWKIYDENSDIIHIGTIAKDKNKGWDYEIVCNMFDDEADNYETNNDFKLFPNAKENAKLIAAAPELLSALLETQALLRAKFHVSSMPAHKAVPFNRVFAANEAAIGVASA